MKVRLTFLEPVLGTWPSNENIARDFIASKAPDASTIEDEIAALGADAVAEKGKTVFPRTDGQPILYDYQIKGFFKDACGMLARVKSKKSSALKAYKKIIDGLIFVEPRMIPIEVNGEIGECQRPLRAQTAQGERVSLANSEEIPAGSSIELDIVMLDEKAHKEAVLEFTALMLISESRSLFMLILSLATQRTNCASRGSPGVPVGEPAFTS